MRKRAELRELYTAMAAEGMLDYGVHIPRSWLLDALGIQEPATATRAEWNQLELQEMAAVDYVRNILLDQGKYLARTRDGYRVALPSENMAMVDGYMEAAERKIRRGQRLLRATPSEHLPPDTSTGARAHLRTRAASERRPVVGRTTPEAQR